MKKATLIKLAAVFAVLLVMLIIVMSVPQWRRSFLSVVSSKPVCRDCGQLHIIHDYYAATGISRDTLGATPAEVVEIYGEPDYIKEEDKGEGWVCERYYYENFAIIFDSRKPGIKDAEDCGGVGFVLYSPDMEIRHDIHVGSSRKQIIHAYRKCPSIVYPETNGGETGDWLYDNGYRNFWDNSLHFTYDEENIVTSITYYP